MGGIMSLLGGGSDYGAGQDRSAMLGALAGAGNNVSQFNRTGDAQMGYYNTDNPVYRDAAARQLAYDQSDPYTDSYSAAALQRARAGATQNYQAAHARLAASLAGSGMVAPGGGGSSVAAGGFGNLEASNANSLGQAQNNVAFQSIAEHQRRMADATNLTGSMAGQDYTRGQGAYGQALSGNMGLANSYGQLYQGDVARQQADSNGVMGLLGDAAGVAGAIYGGGFAGAGRGAAAGAMAGGGGQQAFPGGGWGGFGDTGVGMYRNNPTGYKFMPPVGDAAQSFPAWG